MSTCRLVSGSVVVKAELSPISNTETITITGSIQNPFLASKPVALLLNSNETIAVNPERGRTIFDQNLGTEKFTITFLQVPPNVVTEVIIITNCLGDPIKFPVQR